MSSIAELTDRILAAPAPVVFLDTCAILDVARAAREQPFANIALYTHAFIQRAKSSSPTTYLVIADIVPMEWNNNIDVTKRDSVRSVETTERLISVAKELRLSTGAEPSFGMMKEIPTRLRNLSEELLNTALVIDRTSVAVTAAVDRVFANKKPSNGNEIKDCYIVEHYLAVARELRSRQFAKPLYFVSSNTKDFAQPSSSRIHEDLEPDFTAVRLEYSVNIPAMANKLLTPAERTAILSGTNHPA